MKAKYRLLIYLVSFLALFVSQTAYAQPDRDGSKKGTIFDSTSLRISFHRGFWSGGQPGKLLAAGVSVVPEGGWYLPSFHLYLSSVDYIYTEGLTFRTVSQTKATSITPSVKLFSFLHLGFNYSFNWSFEEKKYSSSPNPDQVHEENGSYFSGVIALETNIRIIKGLYVSGAYTFVRPHGFAVLGLAWRFPLSSSAD